ncbi:MAG TPA: DNA recombination protein RmuC [Steroidobacteraceae bacterium]|nr:DNA recombination protein RmuC [Steroidobacteraceae bacterium]
MAAGWLLLAVGLLFGGGTALLIAWWLASRQRRTTAEVEARLGARFAELANGALRDNSDLFLRLARESFAREQAGAQSMLREREAALLHLVEPISKALEKTEQQLAGIERERRDAFTSLRTQIEQLTLGQSALQRETRNLVGALRRPEVRGRWGELTLRRVVEVAGMSEHCDFSEQASVTGADGTLRPDLVVRMPEGRDLVVDAKTPLDAYLDAIEAPSDEARAAALVRHAQQLEARVRELASKAYWSQFKKSPEFAVLFLPGDQFLSAALAERPELLENAMRQGIVIATPSTLIALFKAVAYGWRQAVVAEHAARILDLGQDLHKRLGTFAGHLERAGQRLGGAVEAYNNAIGSLEKQVLPQARKFTELGAVSGEQLPSIEPVDRLVRNVTLHPDDQPPAGPPATP